MGRDLVAQCGNLFWSNTPRFPRSSDRFNNLRARRKGREVWHMRGARNSDVSARAPVGAASIPRALIPDQNPRRELPPFGRHQLVIWDSLSDFPRRDALMEVKRFPLTVWPPHRPAATSMFKDRCDRTPLLCSGERPGRDILAACQSASTDHTSRQLGLLGSTSSN